MLIIKKNKNEIKISMFCNFVYCMNTKQIFFATLVCFFFNLNSFWFAVVANIIFLFFGSIMFCMIFVSMHVFFFQIFSQSPIKLFGFVKKICLHEIFFQILPFTQNINNLHTSYTARWRTAKGANQGTDQVLDDR